LHPHTLLQAGTQRGGRAAQQAQRDHREAHADPRACLRANPSSTQPNVLVVGAGPASSPASSRPSTSHGRGPLLESRPARCVCGAVFTLNLHTNIIFDAPRLSCLFQNAFVHPYATRAQLHTRCRRLNHSELASLHSLRNTTARTSPRAPFMATPLPRLPLHRHICWRRSRWPLHGTCPRTRCNLSGAPTHRVKLLESKYPAQTQLLFL
jgi:hypothetical protein